MADLIRVDFQAKQKLDTTALPTEDEIFLEQCRAKLAYTQAALAQLELAGTSLDGERVMQHHEDIAGRASDADLLRSLHEGSETDWSTRPEWYAALLAEIDARDTVVARLRH